MVSVSPKYVGATRQKRRGPRRMVEPIQRFRDLGHHSHGLNVSKSADDPLLFRYSKKSLGEPEGGIRGKFGIKSISTLSVAFPASAK
mmetsp:Transcript_9297/g.15095  ORF Transcript_9297/g.15095 Transcript_9297/m.15095 type:complete len:87 (+) Transcript_9297:832-1092(+)